MICKIIDFHNTWTLNTIHITRWLNWKRLQIDAVMPQVYWGYDSLILLDL